MAVTSKTSPFLINDDALLELQMAADLEPAVCDLVSWYQRARADVEEYAVMVEAEMAHYGVTTI